MIENIKLDIIYYGTQKDFEMEFNLCGCCRMRLLTAVAEDLKSFVNCIKVAVARSRVVLLCGKIDGEDGIFNIISKAVGREFEEVENSLYGIAGEGKTKLLKQSIPLVCNDGTFLGCVIEQGPQAIIMLSDNKNGRKEIMQNLIHPFVKELSKSEIATETKAEQESVTPQPTDLSVEEVDETPFAEKTEDLSDETTSEETDSSEIFAHEEPETQSETESVEVVDEGEDEELETVSLSDFSEELPEPQITEPFNENVQEDTDASSFISSETDEEATKTEPQSSGLIFAVPDDDFDESDQKLYSNEAFEDYNNSFSLITHNGGKNQKKGCRGGSLAISILLCVVLCLLAIIAYYLLVKPMQTGVNVGENFNNLFSFALKGVFKPW